jgi:hypothetical protein
MIKSRKMRWAGCVARMGRRGKPEGKKPLGKSRHSLGASIKIDLRNVGWRGMVWIDLAQNRDHWSALVNTVMNLRFHKTLGNS